MVQTFANNPPIQAKSIIDEHYVGLWIEAQGAINDISVMRKYVTFSFEDRDGIHISANFSSPVSSEVSLLKRGDKISLMGQVFNVGDRIVVLDSCQLTSGEQEIGDRDLKEREQAQEASEKNPFPNKWWERTPIQIIMLLGAIAGIIGLILLFR